MHISAPGVVRGSRSPALSPWVLLAQTPSLWILALAHAEPAEYAPLDSSSADASRSSSKRSKAKLFVILAVVAAIVLVVVLVPVLLTQQHSPAAIDSAGRAATVAPDTTTTPAEGLAAWQTAMQNQMSTLARSVDRRFAEVRALLTSSDSTTAAPVTVAPTTLAPTTRTPTTAAPATTSTTSTTMPPGLDPLPRSGANQIAFLVSKTQKRPNGQQRVVARSVAGMPWEVVPDLDFAPVNLTCSRVVDRLECGVPNGASFEVRTVDAPANIRGAGVAGRVARLLLQATFGPTLDEIQSTPDNVTAWLADQMALEPTMLRPYLRQRSNPVWPTNRQSGFLRQACEPMSRWVSYTFGWFDERSSFQATAVGTRFAVRVAGAFRGYMTKLPTGVVLGDNYTICGVNGRINATVQLIDSAACPETGLPNLPDLRFPNPPLSLGMNPPPAAVQVLADADASFSSVVGRSDAFVLRNINVPCTATATVKFFRHKGRDMMHDPRLRFSTNTVRSPARVGTFNYTTCASAAANFLNADTCFRGPSCALPAFSAANMRLNDANLRLWYTDNSTRRFVYYITGLRLEEPYNKSPCRGPSRWKRTAGACDDETALDATTLSTIVSALRASADVNPHVRDITLPGGNCTANTLSIGASVTVGTECFTHVHPDEFSVRDFTRWTQVHPGNTAFPPSANPIERWAKNGLVNLMFPSSHPMSRFFDNKNTIPVIGRRDDSVQFLTLPTELQTRAMAARVGARQVGARGFQMCGSTGEAANNPIYGHRYTSMTGQEDDGRRRRSFDFPINEQVTASIVWLNVVLTAPDQLRQRAAWALAQILTMGQRGQIFDDLNEAMVNYYDIFVRNAFGSYFNVLKEVSYSPLMSLYLSYRGNRAFAVSGGAYPDENYAREIMQLFSVGLWQLNDDGTTKLTAKKEPIPSYSIDDIVDMARAWTGFDFQQPRSGYEARSDNNNFGNFIDPMQIKPGLRDRMPKANLLGGYVGDTYPLCTDLPPQHFLTEGAEFVYTGESSAEGLLMDAEDPLSTGIRGRFAPAPTVSRLWRALCSPGAGGLCRFPSKVVLKASLTCHGVECSAGRVTTVKVVDPVGGVTGYYTYRPVPCVRLAFYGNGQLTVGDSAARQCTNTKSDAAPACCLTTDTKRVAPTNATQCLFANEAVDFATAQARCAALNFTLCDANYTRAARWEETCARSAFQWTAGAPCSLQVQVYPSGQVSLLDGVAKFNHTTLLKLSSGNVFRVRWNQNAWPKVANGTCPTGCTRVNTAQGQTCVCDIVVRDRALYSSADELPAPADIAQRLFIGAPNPSSFGTGAYTRNVFSGTVVWFKASGAEWDRDTIIQLPPYRVGGRPRYLFNRYSSVTAGGFVFRNPPQWMPLAGELNHVVVDWLSDALLLPNTERETDSLLEHLNEHPNTAPFVSYRLIQRMVTSNPSPRYMRSVVQAFRTGRYGDTVLSGKYGDIGAAIVAVLSDREARMPVVEADPVHGALREPMLKVIQVMRSLKYVASSSREVAMDGVFGRIAQDAFFQPSVFGFYLPEYRPEGAITGHGLVSPEAQILTSPNIIEYLNGMASLIDNGLTSCDSGFGWRVHENGRICSRPSDPAHIDGALTYRPAPNATATAVVAELNLLLTARRMDQTTVDVVTKAYSDALATGNATTAFKRALHLITASPEFQASAANLVTTKRRPSPVAVPGGGRRFKAIVVVFEAGAADSFNLVVPHSGCTETDLYAEYVAVRTGAAIPKPSLRTINTTGQPCTTFGVHPAMPRLQQLYLDGDAAFVANVGALVEPVTKNDYNTRASNNKKFPPSLFAHNIMQRSLQSLHAQVSSAKGVLGRLVSSLAKQVTPYSSALYSMLGSLKMLEGAPQPPTMLSSTSGLIRYSRYAQLGEYLRNMTVFKSNSSFADTYSGLLKNGLEKAEAVGALLDQTNATTKWSSTTDLERQMEMVSRLIKLRTDLNLERSVFVVGKGGWDTHNTFDLNPLFGDVDTSLGKFAAEMKAQGVWDDVVVLTVSDFGRTLTSNGKGTDHAWGGNHFIAGGKVKGGRILGQYPNGLTDAAASNIGRGRVIPTTPWESMWYGVSTWFGAEDADLPVILPNAANFPASTLFDRTELFE